MIGAARPIGCETVPGRQSAAMVKASPADPLFALPDRLFFCIGAQRSGTTWLHEYLLAHPEVHVPWEQKELHYWTTWHRPHFVEARKLLGGCRPGALPWGEPSGDDPAAGWRRAERAAFFEAWRNALVEESPGHANYARALFWNYRGEAVAGEITPAYALLGPEAFAAMTALGRDVRFVFVMRDPVGRLHAGIRHALRRAGHGERVSPAAIAERMATVLARPGDWDLLRSRYDLTIRAVEQVVPAAKIAYFFHETMFCQREMDRLCTFLGIAARRAETGRGVNVGDGPVAPLDPTLARWARSTLAPAYEFCARKFGTLPEAWMGAWEVAGAG